MRAAMMSETSTTFRVGDRVLIESINEVGIVIEGLDRGQVCVANNGTVRWREIENLTLVERRWYANPGIAMLALTPEVQSILDKFFGEPTERECTCAVSASVCEDIEFIRAAIAAAQKEKT
jgi:hypothetical protein